MNCLCEGSAVEYESPKQVPQYPESSLPMSIGQAESINRRPTTRCECFLHGDYLPDSFLFSVRVMRIGRVTCFHARSHGWRIYRGRAHFPPTSATNAEAQRLEWPLDRACWIKSHFAWVHLFRSSIHVTNSAQGTRIHLRLICTAGIVPCFAIAYASLVEMRSLTAVSAIVRNVLDSVQILITTLRLTLIHASESFSFSSTPVFSTIYNVFLCCGLAGFFFRYRQLRRCYTARHHKVLKQLPTRFS